MLENIKNNIRQIFSSKNLKEILRRFPLAFAYITGVTIWIVINVITENKTSDTEGKVIYYLYTASLLDVALRLWLETSKFKFHYICYGLAHLLWLANTVWLINMGTISTASMIGNGAALFAIAAFVFVGSYWKSNNDTAFFRFSTYIISLILRSMLAGLILMGGIGLLFLMLDTLFDINISYKFYVTAWFICCWISICYVLINLPQDHQPFEAPIVPSRFGYGLGSFVFLPLACTYTLVLYIYLLRILFTLTLPQGGVVWTISILMAGILATMVLLYPKRTAEGTSRVIETAITWLPRLALPLLVLMSVAIARRIHDYGVTVQRLYVVAFNLWCYFAIIYIIATRAKRVKMLLTSFALVFVLTSIGWQNLTNITSILLQKQLRNTFVHAKPQTKLPMDQKQLQQWVDKASEEEGRNVTSKLFYLKSIDKQAFEKFVRSNVSQYEIELKNDISLYDYINFTLATDTEIAIPVGYRYMFVKTWKLEVNKTDFVLGKARLEGKHKDQKIKATLDWSELERLNALDRAEQNKQQPIACQVNDSTLILINQVWINYSKRDSSSSGTVDCWLFTK